MGKREEGKKKRKLERDKEETKSDNEWKKKINVQARRHVHRVYV